MVPKGVKDTQTEVVMKQTNYIPSVSNALNFEMNAGVLHFRDLCLPLK